jgi:hypothetical protein
MNDKITVTLTHFKRLDLLKETLISFFSTNRYEIDQFLIIDDSGEKYYSDEIKKLYSNFATIIVNNENIGQRRSIDKLIQACNNEYIFHLEEDWLFDSQQINYIEDSLLILKNNLDIHQVHVRHRNDFNQPTVGDIQYTNNIGYKFLDDNWRDCWTGFSFNPGLRRKSDIVKMFPNGLSEFKDEMQASIHTKKFNYKAVLLEKTVCKHIGYGRQTQLGGRGF